MAIYMLAVLAVVLSNVPAGIGVFELVIIAFAPVSATSSLIASLLLFRVIYYLLPLSIAMGLLGTHELLPHRERLKSGFKRGVTWWSAMAPYVFSLGAFLSGTILFLSGTILLLSGATPGIVDRLAVLNRFIPIPLIEISHLVGSVVGACLLLIAGGLYRRLDSAYWLACIFLLAGIVLSLVKGLDVEEAVFLTVILACLWPARKSFYRRGRLTSQPLSPSWMAAIAVVAICVVWLGLFSIRNSQYQNQDWWQIVFSLDSPRGVRATVGGILVLSMFGVLRLLTPKPPERAEPTKQELAEAFAIACRSARTYSYLAMLGDKQLFFNTDRSAYIMYARQGRSWIAMGDPIGPAESIIELVWEFREHVDCFGGWSVFYQVDTSNLTVYVDQGMTMLKIGEEARVPLNNFSLAGSSRKGLRQTSNRMEKEQVTFETVPVSNVPAILPRLRQISNAWLDQKKIPEKGFSLGYYDEDYLKRFPCAVVKQGESIIAFANVWVNDCKDELSIDLMRYEPDSVSGVMEYLFIQLMLWGKQEGYQWFSLGMAPLSGIESRKLSPLWNRFSSLMFKHGDRFYHFEGLRQYKDKFDPEWTSRYIALPNNAMHWKLLADLTQLISRKRTRSKSQSTLC
jgi:phosphatidylglycerol lysyltransferase